jgi:hypothetical protein
MIARGRAEYLNKIRVSPAKKREDVYLHPQKVT